MELRNFRFVGQKPKSSQVNKCIVIQFEKCDKDFKLWEGRKFCTPRIVANGLLFETTCIKNIPAKSSSFLVCKYHIGTYTGDVDNAETLATPYISLYGQTGNSGKRKLLASTNTEPQDMFKRGQVCLSMWSSLLFL